MKRVLKTFKNKFLVFFLQSTIIYFFTVSSAIGFSYGYHTIQLTSNDYDDRSPEINNNGHVVWEARLDTNSSAYEIFYYDGNSTTNLTNNDSTEVSPQINDNGDVVWKSYGGGTINIILYDGTTRTTSQISSSNYFNYDPQINNRGDVAWTGHLPVYTPPPYDTDIFLYNGTTTTRLTTDNDFQQRWPQLNDYGVVVWQGHEYFELVPTKYDIFLHDGTTRIQLTDTDNHQVFPQINNNGEVVWSGSDGTDHEIFLYDGTETIQLTNNENGDGRPQINNNGEVVWSGSDGTDNEIFLYDGIVTTQLTNNDYDDFAPEINNNGHVVWIGGVGGADNEIFVYDGTETIQLTGNDDFDSHPRFNDNARISDNGCVVWEGWNGSGYLIFNEIFLSCPSPLVSLTHVEYRDTFWWKSEEYWGGDIPIIPREVGIDIPEIEPEPLPCPECAFSKAWQLSKMPSHLPYLYQSAHGIFGKPGQPKSFKKNRERIITHLKDIPAGQRYNESMKASVIKAMQGWDGSSKEARPISGEVLQAMNAIELDWRVPALTATKVGTGKNHEVNFEGVAWVKIKEVKKAGKLFLNVDGNLPALVAESRPVWPVASYHFDFTGELSDNVDISFYFGGYRFKGSHSSLHLLEWDGKSYRDITTVVDWSAKVITGRTNRLSTYVIAGPGFSKGLNRSWRWQ